VASFKLEYGGVARMYLTSIRMWVWLIEECAELPTLPDFCTFSWTPGIFQRVLYRFELE